MCPLLFKTRRIKTDQAKFSEDPEKYIDVSTVFSHIQCFGLENITQISKQCLTATEKTAILEAVESYWEEIQDKK